MDSEIHVGFRERTGLDTKAGADMDLRAGTSVDLRPGTGDLTIGPGDSEDLDRPEDFIVQPGDSEGSRTSLRSSGVKPCCGDLDLGSDTGDLCRPGDFTIQPGYFADPGVSSGRLWDRF